MITITITSAIISAVMLLIFAYGLEQILYTLNVKVNNKWKYGNIVYWVIKAVLFNISLIILLPIYFLVKKNALKTKTTQKKLLQSGIKKVVPAFVVYFISVNVLSTYYTTYQDKKDYDNLPLYQKLSDSLNSMQLIDGDTEEGFDAIDDGMSVYPISEAKTGISDTDENDNEETTETSGSFEVELVPTEDSE